MARGDKGPSYGGAAGTFRPVSASKGYRNRAGRGEAGANRRKGEEMMRRYQFLAGLALLLLTAAGPASALHEFEVWRSPFGQCGGFAVDPTDGSVWASLGDAVCRYAAGHALLSKSDLCWPHSISANPRDGSCWVVDWEWVDAAHLKKVVKRLGADGTPLVRVESFRYDPLPAALTGPDGSVWVSVLLDAAVYRLSTTGQIAAQASGFVAGSLATNPDDGTCWAMDITNHQLAHLAMDGAVLWRGGSFQYPGGLQPPRYLLACDARDSSVWAVDRASNDLVHVSEAGAELSRTHFPDGLTNVSLNAADGTSWVGGVPQGLAHVGGDGSVLGYLVGPPDAVGVDPHTGAFWGFAGEDLRHFAADGAEVWHTGETLHGLDFDESGDSLWTWSSTGELLRLSTTAEELWRGVPYEDPFIPTGGGVLNPADGSLYFLSGQQATLLRLGRDGTRQWTSLIYAPPLTTPAEARAMAVNPADGSFWADVGDGTDAHGGPYPLYCHFSAEGQQLASIAGLQVHQAAVDPADGSVWLEGLASGTDRVAHFAAGATELWGQDLDVTDVLVDLRDGSCWTGGSSIRHFAQDGTLLLQIPADAHGIAVDLHTGCCWAAQGPFVSVYDPAGRFLWLGRGFSHVGSMDVDSRNGSVWIDDTNQLQLVHLWAPTTPFYDVLPDHWASRAVRMCYEYGIVGGYPDGYYRPDWGVSRAQMAGFISRALAGGDGNVPPGPATPHFPDVGTDYWAYKYIEYAYANNIVNGYPNGEYWPELAVDRGQMAAFIARAIVTPTGEAGLTGYTPPATPTFPDVPTDYWTYKHIEYIKSQGIVGGYPDGLYHPGDLCTRDQMAVFVARAFELLPY